MFQQRNFGRCRLFGQPWVRLVLVAAIIIVLGYIVSYFTNCSKLIISDWIGTIRPKFVCVNFQGGMGNHMFLYAFGYATSQNRNLQLVVKRDNLLLDKFHIEPSPLDEFGFCESTCKCFKRAENVVNCGYDASLESLPDTDLSFIGYYQSWKYWIRYEDILREKFTFRDNVLKQADKQLRTILKIKNIPENQFQKTTLVGVHIRNGDFTRQFGYYGFNVAPRSYLHEAMQYFRDRYKNLLFIMATNELQWTVNNFGSMSDVHIVTNNSAVIDMCLLSRTNHTIMTTGTFGWMIGWLTRGTTLFYKYPYRKESDFSKHFHSNLSDYFYPGWIGLGEYQLVMEP